MRLTLWRMGCVVLLSAVPLWATGQDGPENGMPSDSIKVVPVWPGAAPGSEKWSQTEVEYRNGWDHKQMVRNTVRPTLFAYLPDPSKAVGTAVIVCPGGAFRFLSWESEGTEVAEWLRVRGVAACVLRYRLKHTGETPDQVVDPVHEDADLNDAAPPKLDELAIADGRQAVKVVRLHAAEWGIAPDRVGMLGFSAGGVVTMGVVNGHDAESRPNFAAPIYGGGRLEGTKAPADAPPLFILCAGDDDYAATASARLYSDWKNAGVSAELHIYSKGGHGFGMNKRGLPVDGWIERYGDWLQAQGLLKPTPKATATAPVSARSGLVGLTRCVG